MIKLPENITAGTRTMLWFARISSILVILPLMMIVIGEAGSGPSGWREWMYLALFPFGFSTAYVLGWWKPFIGGVLSLACMIVSLVVIGRVFAVNAYVVWGVLCIPGILYAIGGARIRNTADTESGTVSGDHPPDSSVL